MIDIVIPHVDGSAPGYEALCLQHGVPWVPCQVRELGLLRFVLRSIEAHAPWVRQVTVAVQDEGHLPSWLAREQVRIARHVDFIPAEHLPTFHWRAISAHLHRIPDLADRFVIWEDDTFAGGSLTEASLFAADGLPRTDPVVAPILPGLERWLGAYQWTLKWSRDVILRRSLPNRPFTAGRRACFLFPHMPSAVHLPTYRRMFEEFMQDPWFADTVSRRSAGDAGKRPTIDPFVVHANWIDIVERRRLSAGRYLDCLRWWASLIRTRVPVGRRPPLRWGDFSLVNDASLFQRRMRRLKTSLPLFFNINDDAYDGYRDEAGHLQPGDAPPNPRCLDLLLRTLNELYPRPSRFERYADAQH